jgi:opacity protein-like surface antigen
MGLFIAGKPTTSRRLHFLRTARCGQHNNKQPKQQNNTMKSKPTILLTALALAATSILATAQDAPKPATPNAPPADGGRQRGQGGQGGGDFMQRMNDRLKTSLKVTDEEWTVLQPLIEKVQTKQRDATAGRFGGFGGGGRRGGDNNTGGGTPPADTRPGSAESTALRTALESDATSADDLKAKLTAVREVRKKGAAELATAREDLKKVVTVRQEAVLVSMGILE